MLLGKGELPVFLLLGRNMKGFSGCIYKKFDTKDDAEAFIHSHKGCHKGLVSPDYYVYTDGVLGKRGLVLGSAKGSAAGSGETDQ